MKHFVKTHGKLLIGITVVFVIVAVWMWFAGSARQQTSFRQTNERVNQAKGLIKDATTGKRANRLAALKSLASLNTEGTCRGDWWNDWQQSIVPSVMADAKRCRAKEDTLSAVIQAANAVYRHITDETSISKQLALLTVDSTAKDWSTKAKTAADNALKALGGIRAVSTAQPVLKAAKARITAIISGWNSLSAASDKQDKNAYMTAEAQLKQAYADLAAIADVSDEQLLKLMNTLMTTAKPL